MTVEELYEQCKEKVEEGFGEQEIVLCVNDDEFHPLESGFSSPIYNNSNLQYLLEEWEADEDNVVVLN